MLDSDSTKSSVDNDKDDDVTEIERVPAATPVMTPPNQRIRDLEMDTVEAKAGPDVVPVPPIRGLNRRSLDPQLRGPGPLVAHRSTRGPTIVT